MWMSVLNLTAGMGGDLVFGDVERPLPVNAAGTDMAGATKRVVHVADCLPEICTLDCGTMNFNLGDYVMTNTPPMLREMARQMADSRGAVRRSRPSTPAISGSRGSSSPKG